MKKVFMVLALMAALMAAFLAGAAVMAHSTTTVRMSSNLREAGEETVIEETVEEENILEETIYWENVEVETF